MVTLLQIDPDGLTHMGQYVIPGEMAVYVVHQLEVIHIDDKQGPWILSGSELPIELPQKRPVAKPVRASFDSVWSVRTAIQVSSYGYITHKHKVTRSGTYINNPE